VARTRNRVQTVWAQRRSIMERIDDLERDGLRILQNPDKFCFGIDAVLLSDFAKVKPGETMVDIGTGTGVIPILLTSKCPGAKVYYGLEIQEYMADMAGRSVEMNGLTDQVKIICGDVKNVADIFGYESANVVTCNPPYMNDAKGLINPNESLAIARHEILCTLDDIVAGASLMLKTGGRFYMIHRPHRLVEIFECMRAHKLEPKRMQMVYPHAGDNANMVLIEAHKNEGAFLKVESPIIIYK